MKAYDWLKRLPGYPDERLVTRERRASKALSQAFRINASVDVLKRKGIETDDEETRDQLFEEAAKRQARSLRIMAKATAAMPKN